MGFFGDEQKRRNKKFLSACEWGDWKKAEKLLSEGADLNAKNPSGCTALFLAAYRGQASVMEKLLEKGLDPNIGLTAPFDKDYRYFSAGYTPLMAASYMGKESCVALLLQHGADVNRANSEGRTALHYAARWGQFPVVRQLVEAGADLNAYDNDGKKPLTLAEEQRQRGVATYLTDKMPAKKSSSIKTGWALTAPAEVACVSEKAAVGYKLTDIFNFESREHTRIAANLETGAESQSVRNFDEFSDKKILEEAHRHLVKLGGKADIAVIYGKTFGKKSFPKAG